MRRLEALHARSSFLALALLLLLGATACHSSSSSSNNGGTPDPAAPGEEASAPVAPTPSASASAPPVRPPPPVCRAASVGGGITFTALTGTPRDAAAPFTLVASSDIPDDVWIDIDKAGRLTARHPRSTRETSFLGPSRVRPCVLNREEGWLASGKFESVLTSGERPGGEEWIVTPVGVVRYGSAKLEIAVTGAVSNGTAIKADVKVLSGVAFAWTGDKASAVVPPDLKPVNKPADDGWTRLDGARSMTLSLPLSLDKNAKPETLAGAAVERCKTEVQGVKDLATAMAGDASLAQIAPKHVVARHRARAACGVAGLRVDLLPPSAEREGLTHALEQADLGMKSRPRGRPSRPH